MAFQAQDPGGGPTTPRLPPGVFQDPKTGALYDSNTGMLFGETANQAPSNLSFPPVGANQGLHGPWGGPFVGLIPPSSSGGTSPNPSSLLSGGGSSGGSGGIGGGGGGGSTPVPANQLFTGAPSADPNETDRARAQDLIDLQFNPQQNALQRLLQMIQLQTQRDVSTQERFSETGDARLAAINEELQRRLNANAERISGIFDDSQGSINQFFGESQETAGQLGGDIARELAENAERLGISGTGSNEALSNLDSELKTIQSRQTTNRAGALSNLENLGGQIEGTAVQAISDAAREGAQSRTNLLSQIAAAIADAQATGATQRFDVGGKLSDLGESRGIAQRTTLQEIVQERLDRERQARVDQLNEEMQRAQLQLQRDQLAAQRAAAASRSSGGSSSANKMAELMALGQAMGLEGQELMSFVAMGGGHTPAELEAIGVLQGEGPSMGDFSGTSGVRDFLALLETNDPDNPNNFHKFGDVFLNEILPIARQSPGNLAGNLNALIGTGNRFDFGSQNPVFNELINIVTGAVT